MRFPTEAERIAKCSCNEELDGYVEQKKRDGAMTPEIATLIAERRRALMRRR